MKLFLKLIGIGFGLLLIMVVIAYIWDANLTPEERAKMEQERKTNDSLAVLKAQANASQDSIAFNPEFDLKVFARMAMDEKLTAPASAKYSEVATITKSRIDPMLFQVSGYVDAQNAFGAMLRTKYMVVLRFNGDFKKEEEVKKFSNWLVLDAGSVK